MLFLLTLLFAHAFAQDSNCDFQQAVQPSQTYYIASPGYSGSYPAGVTCRWQATCPSGYQCRLDCDLKMPLNDGCTIDRLLISKSGDPQLNNADFYCGSGTLPTMLSVNQKISVGLIVSPRTPGGNFICKLTAQALTTPPQSCRCGITKQNRIVGGTQAGPNEFTMMAAINEKDSDGRVYCGAVIITDRVVLTAAHCLDNQTPSNLIIIIGNSNIDRGQRYNVVSFTKHPNYNPNTYDYDIAVVTLASVILFNENLSPVCLPFKFQNTDLTGRNVTLLGWGTTSFGGPVTSNLLKTNVAVISQQQCQQTDQVTNRQICTKTPGNDACQNDSGGPCLYADPQTGLQFLVGTISSGFACASQNRPGINTRTTALLQWIVNTVRYDYCVK